MFKHIVMWKLKETAEGGSKAENAEKMKTILCDLKDRISHIKHIEVGMDVSGTERSFDVVLIAAFETREDCAAYMKHPDHIQAGRFIGKVVEKRVLVDYEA
jgi:hypothetical protein